MDNPLLPFMDFFMEINNLSILDALIMVLLESEAMELKLLDQCGRLPMSCPGRWVGVCGEGGERVSVMVSDSVFSAQYSFEQILNEIPCVSCFSIFLLALNFGFQIRNHHCAPNRQQGNLITFIRKLNINTSLSY